MPPAALSAPQPLQDRRRGEPVGHLPDRGLEVAQRAAGLAAEPAIGLAHVVAARGKMLLQLVALRSREHPFVPRPSLHEGIPAAQPIGEIADGERIGFGRIVFHDDAEILQHQKARALRPRRYQQIGAVFAAREGLAAGAPDAQALPLPHREDTRAVSEQEIETRRHHDLVAPGLTAYPSVLLEIVRGGSHHVGYGIDDVAAAVTIEIDGIALERSWHELGRTERVRPRALEVLGLHIAT